MSSERPLLAPTDTLQRTLYAGLCFIAPRVLISMAYREQVDSAWFILCGWWMVTFLYTIDWAISSYRKYRDRKKLLGV